MRYDCLAQEGAKSMRGWGWVGGEWRGGGVGGEWRAPASFVPTPASCPARDWTRDNRISSSFWSFRTFFVRISSVGSLCNSFCLKVVTHPRYRWGPQISYLKHPHLNSITAYIRSVSNRLTSLVCESGNHWVVFQRLFFLLKLIKGLNVQNAFVESI